jgi:hypothetical protein
MIDYEKYKNNGELSLWAVYFQKVEKLLEGALEYDNTHNMQDVADCIDRCTMQLWTGDNSAVVTQVQEFPRMKVLHIYLASGDLKELETLTPRIQKFAEDTGCRKITLTGRRGWSRTFVSKFNMKPTHYWLSTEV